METIIPTSFVGMVTACVLLLYVALQVTIDSLDIHRLKQLGRIRTKRTAKKKQVSFTIVVVTAKKIESVIPLLTSIYSHNTHTTEVLVELKYSAGKTAQRQLVSLRRKNNWSGLRIIAYKKGQSHEAILKRYAKNDIIIELLPQARLSLHFFDDVMSEIALVPGTSILLNQRYALDDTLTNAFATHFEQWVTVYNTLFPVTKNIQPSMPMVAYVRSLDQPKQQVLTATTARQATVQLEQAGLSPVHFARYTVTRIRDMLTVSKVLLSIGIVIITGVCLALTSSQSDITLLFMTIVVGYIVFYTVNMMRIKSYSFLDKMNLFLLSPFALMYGLFLTISAVTIYAMGPLLAISKQSIKMRQSKR